MKKFIFLSLIALISAGTSGCCWGCRDGGGRRVWWGWHHHDR